MNAIRHCGSPELTHNVINLSVKYFFGLILNIIYFSVRPERNNVEALAKTYEVEWVTDTNSLTIENIFD